MTERYKVNYINMGDVGNDVVYLREMIDNVVITGR